MVASIPAAAELFPCAVVPWLAVRLRLVGARGRHWGHAPDGPPPRRPVNRLEEEQMSRRRAAGGDVSCGDDEGRAWTCKFNLGKASATQPPVIQQFAIGTRLLYGSCGLGCASFQFPYFGRPRKAPSRTNGSTLDPPTSTEGVPQHESSGVVDGAAVVDWCRPHSAGHEPVMESLRPDAAAYSWQTEHGSQACVRSQYSPSPQSACVLNRSHRGCDGSR